MRENAITLTILLALSLSLGCAGTGSPPDVSARPPGPITTHDGLVKIDIDRPGELFLREDHGIGGYDAIVIVPSFVNYQRKSARLDEDLENAYLAALEQTVYDAAESANVEVVRAVGDCVIKVGAGFVNVNLARAGSRGPLGEMTLIIEYQDSMSRQSLLRYSAKERVERERDGTSRKEQVRTSFGRMIDDVDIISALRKATSVPSPPRQGCNGSLVKAGLPSTDEE